jgi:hypothetical protein
LKKRVSLVTEKLSTPTSGTLTTIYNTGLVFETTFDHRNGPILPYPYHPITFFLYSYLAYA